MFRRSFAMLLAMTLTLASTTALAADKAEKAKSVDLVLCIDTSNSMDGLIASAKARLWDVVNDLAKAKPTPNLRVALYSYGNDTYNRTNGWVRQDLDFTTDLDKVNEKLFALTTRGGTEYVARVCKTALDDLKWSADKGALKMLFVCGNEPASQDPNVKLKDVAELACKSDVIINTIYCGAENSEEAKSWREFAVFSEGRFASIDQNRAIVVAATPFDKDLAEMSGKLNRTYAFFGRDAQRKCENQVLQDSNAEKMGKGVAAARAESKANALYRHADDLVDCMKNDPKFDIKKVDEKDLPENMKKMTPEERENHVKQLAKDREDIQKKINELSAKRDKHLREEMKKSAGSAEKALDEALKGALREQAKKKGIAIPE